MSVPEGKRKVKKEKLGERDKKFSHFVRNTIAYLQ